MKQLGILLAVLVSAVGSRAQEMKMHLHLKSGKTISYAIDSIRTLTTVNTPSTHYYVINVFTPQSVPSPIEVHTVRDSNYMWADSITFDRDSFARRLIRMYPFFSTDGLLLTPLDSIAFSQFERDTNIIRYSIKYYKKGLPPGGGYYPVSLWNVNKIFSIVPLRITTLDSDLIPVFDTTPPGGIRGGVLSMRMSPDCARLLFVQSRYVDVSIGRLKEYDTATDSAALLLNDTSISRAVYLSADSIIYYTYGSFTQVNRTPADAGYYLYERKLGRSTLLLAHISDLGPDEMVNGFDISPDGKKLLIPLVASNAGPFIAEYDLRTHNIDTLGVSFNGPENGRFALWLRYNHDGSQILYSNYPLYSFSDGNASSDSSEIGIIERRTLAKTRLYPDPDNERTYISVFPEWSPDEKKIVFGSAAVLREPPGSLDNYHPCVLKLLH